MGLADSTSRTTPREWLLSMLGHGIIFGLIIWLSPLHDVIMPANTTKPNPAAAAKAAASQLPPPSPEQLKEVIQSIAEKQKENAKETVSEMIGSEKQIDDLVHTRIDALKQQATEITAAAPQAALDQLKQVAQNQNDAAQNQQKLANEIQPLAAEIQAARAANDPAALQKAQGDLAQLENELHQAQAGVKDKQVAAQDGQEKATHLLNFVQSSYADSAAAQAAADAAQAAATDSQRQVIDHESNDTAGLKEYLRLALEAKTAQDELNQLHAAIDQSKQRQAQDDQAVKTAEAQWRAAQKAFEDAQKLAQQSKTPADQAAADAARNAAQSARKAADQAHQAQSAHQEWAVQTGLQNNLNQAQQRLDNANHWVGAANAGVGDPAPLTADQQKAAQDQANASKAQADAITKLSAAVAATAAQGTNPTAANGAAPPATGAGDVMAGTPVPPAAPDLATLDGKDLAQLFHAAQDTETRVTDKYQVFRAAELASIQKITMAEAMKETQVARPQREKINTALLASNGENTDLGAYKAEVIKADGQLASMIALSNQMLAEMEGQEKESGSGTVDVSNWLKSQGDNYEQQKAMATDSDDNVAGKDLTGLMKGGGGGGSPLPDGQKIDPALLHSYARNAPELPAMDLKNSKPYATRRITADGLVHNDWVYVDSWYLIGPFPNEGRRNLYTHFPPESIVDLNASYIGKYGKPIHWQYLQWNHPMLNPPNDVQDAPAIYYAYTELYFDQPRDLWIATGSDDKGIIWLNNILIWSSGDEFKAWEPNEGYRKVHFQQGVNRILYRLENGQLSAAMSFMISLKN